MVTDEAVAPLSGDQPVKGSEGMAENMTMADYVAADKRRRAEAQAEPTKPEPAAKEAPTVDATPEAEATPDAAAEEPAKPDEQGAETDPETEDVLSNFDPKAKEKIHKRIGVLTARAKEAEEKAKAAADEKAQLLAKVEQLSQQQQQQPEPVPVILGEDPNDLAAKATTVAEIDKVEQSAREMLDLIDKNEHLIARAFARDDETVTLSDGQTYKVASIPQAKWQAKAHLDKYVPARKAFLQQRQTAVEAAKGKFPALFKADAEEHLAFQSAVRQTPALRHIPNAELLYGYALRGLKAEQAEQEAAAKKAKVEPASAQPAKAASEVVAAGTPARSGKGGTAAAKRELEAKLAAAEKEMERTGSMQAYSTITKLKRQINNL